MPDQEPFENPASATRLCEKLLQQWDPMFSETVDPTRMRRMDEILHVLSAHFRGSFRVLDLGSGPGPLTLRILRRFPKSRVVAVDTDPVLVRIGEEALHRFGRRATWVLADLREKDWSAELPVHRFDAAVSSLALHWLHEQEIRGIYRDLRRLLRPGGLLVNGDYLPSREPGNQPSSSRSSADLQREIKGRRARVQAFKSEWEAWWGELEREPSMRAVLRERRVRIPGKIPPRRTTGPRVAVSLEAHERALRDAGFRETTVSWQDRGFRVLKGIR
ncbi:MAG: class I SAM-dependent methyltransferase [Thermoplasmata archaeon]